MSNRQRPGNGPAAGLRCPAPLFARSGFQDMPSDRKTNPPQSEIDEWARFEKVALLVKSTNENEAASARDKAVEFLRVKGIGPNLIPHQVQQTLLEHGIKDQMIVEWIREKLIRDYHNETDEIGTSEVESWTMSRQLKVFDRAAVCERVMNWSSDPLRKENFKQLHDMWIGLANQSTSMSTQELVKEINSIEDIMHGAATKPTLR
jgi:hypothetical protein